MFDRIGVLRRIFATLVMILGCSHLCLADSLRLTLQPDDLGPFQPGVGGFIDFAVEMEMVDTEGDGVDTQGIMALGFDILTDTGLSIPVMSPALTGEIGLLGAVDVRDDWYWASDSTEPEFIGGYGFVLPDCCFGGASDDDDLLGVGGVHSPFGWQADVQPNAPGLQPPAQAGIGYGERPAGGDWLFADGQIPIPSQAGLYTVVLISASGMFLLPGIDLTVDQSSGHSGVFSPDQLLGDSFRFTVLPEPGSFVILLCGVPLLSRRRM